MFSAARVAPEKAVFRPALPMLSLPGFTGEHMAKMTYAEQLKHPNWQRKRLEMLNAADWGCSSCGCKDVTLHVHHKKYVKGRMAWEYSDEELAVLCENCHQDEHSAQDDIDYLLAAEWMGKDMTGRDIVLGFLAGFLGPFAKGDERLQQIMNRGIRRDLPFFDIGFMVAALGPDDLKAAVSSKRAEGRLPEAALISYVLGEEGS